MEKITSPSNTSYPGIKWKGFYIAFSIMATLVVLIGFSSTYIFPMLNKTFSGRSMVHVHGALFFLWMLLFILQPILVRMGYTHIHKKVGVPAFILAFLMMIMGVTVAISSAQLGRSGPVLPPNSFLIIPLTDMTLFATFIGSSLYNLKRPEYHKRHMVLATASILPAAIGRMAPLLSVTNPLIIIMMFESPLLLAVTCDYGSRKKIHPVYLWGGLFMSAVFIFRFPLSKTTWWLSIADWLIQ